MSKRNAQEAKRAARERLRAEREKEARKEKTKRQLVVGAVAIAVLAVAGFAGMAIANMGGGGSDTDWGVVERQVAGEAEEGDDTYPDAAPANATGDDGLTVLIGDDDAPHTLSFFEEPRCGGCASFEQNMGETINAGIAAGDYNGDFTFGAFFDDNPQVGGDGSKNAISAMGAALNVSEEAFLGYVEELYSTEFHTSANGLQDFDSDDKLVEIGKKVEALDADFAQFEKDVRDSTFAVWAVQMAEKFSNSGVESTPTVMVDGEMVTTPETPEMLQAAIEASAAQGNGNDTSGDEGAEADTEGDTEDEESTD
ncbi:thioredoxin domain-containing protein [Streptomyces otsuchiensis]|uniref:thioredoxin domain-containing protein n=1 Tax=Streptomyces otsuchiensis TaxID=2681388 RepID=UPI0010303E66|nr:thioredoxin domain-containing protein [Streptomyces otsuchiensis]